MSSGSVMGRCRISVPAAETITVMMSRMTPVLIELSVCQTLLSEDREFPAISVPFVRCEGEMPSRRQARPRRYGYARLPTNEKARSAPDRAARVSGLNRAVAKFSRATAKAVLGHITQQLEGKREFGAGHARCPGSQRDVTRVLGIRSGAMSNSQNGNAPRKFHFGHYSNHHTKGRQHLGHFTKTAVGEGPFASPLGSAANRHRL